MPTFTDKLGQTWDVEITGATVRRTQRLLGVDIGKPREGPKPWLPRFDDPEEIAFKVDLIYVICMPQIRDRGWTDEEFAELLSDNVLMDASIAVYGALTNFFLNLGSHDNAIATQAQLAMLPEVYGYAARRSQSLLARRLGTLCSSWPPSPAPTQNREVSANLN